MPIDVETATVAKLVRRIRHKNAIAEAGLTGVDLEQRARRLAREYELPLPNSIGWVTNQKERFGSCSIDSGDIRISSRLAKVPLWVLDSVILHELTHLIEPGHSAEFYRLMRRYPNLDRADGFLDAMSLGHADPRWEP